MNLAGYWKLDGRAKLMMETLLPIIQGVQQDKPNDYAHHRAFGTIHQTKQSPLERVSMEDDAALLGIRVEGSGVTTLSVESCPD
jgi:hypothetical protein